MKPATGPVTVLVSSAGRRGALVKALRHGADVVGVPLRVVATDMTSLTAAGHLADELHRVPPVTDPTFVPTLLEVCRTRRVDVIVPTIDPELPVLAAERARFAAAGTSISVSDPTVVDVCGDKACSSAWLAANGFPVPRQWEPHEALAFDADAWPLFFKPRQGSSSIGAIRLDGPDELAHAVVGSPDGVVEELLVGQEYTMDCWVDAAGRCRAVVPRLRLETRAGEVSKGVTVAHPELQRLSCEVVEALPGARGVITLQAIVTADGPRFIEINPRFGGGYPLSHHAGAWFTAALLAEAAGRPVRDEWFGWRDGQVMLRYDEAVFVSCRAVGL